MKLTQKPQGVERKNAIENEHSMLQVEEIIANYFIALCIIYLSISPVVAVYSTFSLSKTACVLCIFNNSVGHFGPGIWEPSTIYCSTAFTRT